MGDDVSGPSLGREVMLRAVPLAIVVACAWWFLDAPDWIWLLPLGAALLVLLGRGLRAMAPPPPEEPEDHTR
jgi:hypothetical protein